LVAAADLFCGARRDLACLDMCASADANVTTWLLLAMVE
jgi:hypothetical protein